MGLVHEQALEIGFNTDIFDTNLINLTIVIGVVVTLVGDALTSALDERRRSILSSLEDANNKFNEAQNVLKAAQAKLEESKAEALSIERVPQVKLSLLRIVFLKLHPMNYKDFVHVQNQIKHWLDLKRVDLFT